MEGGDVLRKIWRTEDDERDEQVSGEPEDEEGES
jgi:hypothetical protein